MKLQRGRVPSALVFVLVLVAPPARIASADAHGDVAIPGQALACMVGQIEYRELRARAEQALGGKVDLRAFHRAVLADGAIPMFQLEQRIDRGIDGKRRAS